MAEVAAPGDWDSLSSVEDNQAVILVADYFDADIEELDRLTEFVERGNYVFVIARTAANDVETYFGFSSTIIGSYNGDDASDSLHVNLVSPAFSKTPNFTYPGKKHEGAIYVNDTTRAAVLGRNENGQANFVQFNKGRGSFFFHAAPLAFSNYFILHKANAAYYEQAVSVLPKDLQTIVWDEYFLRKQSDKKEPNWLGALLSFPSFKWGLLVGAATLALAILLGMRRRQRMIPPHQSPKNDSLDFVKTLGRLYYDRKDHKNLAVKMATYFLEHLRSRYKLPTHTLDEAFVQALHFKSGFPEAETKQIIDTIHHIKTTPIISETELAAFHRQLEAFYQNT
jgi:hypothetical protein